MCLCGEVLRGTYSLWNILYPPYDHLLGTRKVLEYDGVHMKIDYGYYELEQAAGTAVS